MRMLRILTIATAAAGVALVSPTDADAQASTQEVSNCGQCLNFPYCWSFHHKNNYSGGSYAAVHQMCIDGSDCTGHPLCGWVYDASPSELSADERLKEILNTMEGDERIVAILKEFPSHVALTASGDALEVDGMLCEEGQLIGRLLLTTAQRQRIAPICPVGASSIRFPRSQA